MTDRFSKVSADFEREVREVAADLVEAGRFPPDEALKKAVPLALGRFAARAKRKEEFLEHHRVITNDR